MFPFPALFRAGVRPTGVPAVPRWFAAFVGCFVGVCSSTPGSDLAEVRAAERPNIVLCMADDQGWGDVGYRGHEVLKTPVLDEMAASALRLDRFYAAAPVCSPTRGSVLTGRHPNRFGCFSWGHTLRPEEVTIAEVLRKAGYATGHFGKWHLGSVAADSPVSPGGSGFDRWLSSPNFFENDPLLSDMGKVIQAKGESSQVTVDAAIKFIRESNAREQPFLAVVWFGSPHGPHVASEEFAAMYKDQPKRLQHFYGEITGMDHAIGNLRRALRDLDIADNTVFWYTSDNGALPVGSTGGLTGKKGNLGEGGLRVPTIIEWPAKIRAQRTSELPGGTVDIYPTLVDIVDAKVARQPILDGISLLPLIDGSMTERSKPLGFWVYPTGGRRMASAEILRKQRDAQSNGQTTKRNPNEDISAPLGKGSYSPDDLPGPAAWIDGDFKLHRQPKKQGGVMYRLVNLKTDMKEKQDLSSTEPKRLARMKEQLNAWQRSVVGSLQDGR